MQDQQTPKTAEACAHVAVHLWEFCERAEMSAELRQALLDLSSVCIDALYEDDRCIQCAAVREHKNEEHCDACLAADDDELSTSYDTSHLEAGGGE